MLGINVYCYREETDLKKSIVTLFISGLEILKSLSELTIQKIWLIMGHIPIFKFQVV